MDVFFALKGAQREQNCLLLPSYLELGRNKKVLYKSDFIASLMIVSGCTWETGIRTPGPGSVKCLMRLNTAGIKNRENICKTYSSEFTNARGYITAVIRIASYLSVS